MAVDGKKMSVSSINFSRTVRAVKLGWLSALGVSHSESVFVRRFSMGAWPPNGPF